MGHRKKVAENESYLQPLFLKILREK